jgi:thiosulfate/3-mercaptopyruvate sulfurtransferase
MRTITVGLALLVGSSVACEPGDREREPAAQEAAETRVGEGMLVTADWLDRNRDQPGVLVVHVGGTRTEYDADHIAGAHYLPLSAVSVERDGLMGQLPAVEELEATFAEIEATQASRVVFYGPPLAAARAFVAMDVLGLGDRAALLDGGLAVWREEGRPFAQGDTERRSDPTDRGNAADPGDPGSQSAPRSPTDAGDTAAGVAPQPERVVDAEWVNDRRERTDVVLLDARPPEQYSGEVAGDDVPRAGHIPGAHNIFWERTLESVGRPVLQDPDTLRALFEGAGVDPGDTVVTYCRSGLQSSFLYFVSRYLGYETRLYDGSFMDWSRRSELPVATGSALEPGAEAATVSPSTADTR